MIHLDTRRIVEHLKTIESLAVIPRVASTNLIARRIVAECIENELSLPQAMIIAEEQFAGMGRNARSWSSPAGKGIYATTLLTRPTAELTLIPLAIANIVVTYLRDIFAIDARIKWPNDILVDGRKIAGILIEARVQDDRTFLVIGVGINVDPIRDDTRPNAIAIREVSKRTFGGVAQAIEAFIEHLDARLSRPFDREAVLAEWRALSVHKPGDRIASVVGERTINGTWVGIDDQGRAMVRNGDEVMTISAGDLIMP
ncbi:MAG TPA: biotin--[acetyl-CoA-carboxylase] ligase [Thermoanaerobaculia bacterium]|nr:biotin--[acetyl-CoA-carboxylase] ligase [Thermoanaerobaculia bacterium]